ncbi:Anti-sigma-K factor RskA [Krasilnikoviella flava]|uniref:Regulator of SigK n=2 Tax=Krasilnikoviella flava TaxID=526729 RepID=A0A1T5IND9_9MICO|nr:Anti-sigma-K factor RskA [Krasilnikoviella flava]
MTRDAWDLLPAYALDAVDDLERRAVERLLASDADARRALDEYRDVVAAFAVEADPPAQMRDAVLARLAGTPQLAPPPQAARQTGGAPAPAPSADRPRRRRWGLVAAAAAAVVAVAVPTTIAVQEHREAVRWEAQADRVAQMLADPEARLVTAPVEGGGEATALVSGDDVLVSAEGMPDAGEGHDWQLWVVADDAPVSAGLMPAATGGVSRALVEGGAGHVVAVTLEPAGGSDQPTTDPVLAIES